MQFRWARQRRLARQGTRGVDFPDMATRLPALPASVRGKDYIETRDWSDREIELLLKTASDLKKAFKSGRPTRYLPDKTVFLFFFDKSTRTRNSFEAGATQLGAHAHFIAAETSQAAHGESPKDMGIILSSYGHAIAIRHDLVPGEGNRYMREVAEHATVPVYNMQCDVDHPFQTLADLMTIREEFGRNLKGRKIAVTWAYAPSYAKPMSVPQGLITLMPRFGLDVVLAHPPEWKLMKEPMAFAREQAETARHVVRGDRRHGRGVPRRGHRLREVVGHRGAVSQARRGPQAVEALPELDLRRAEDETGAQARDLHALPSR